MTSQANSVGDTKRTAFAMSLQSMASRNLPCTLLLCQCIAVNCVQNAAVAFASNVCRHCQTTDVLQEYAVLDHMMTHVGTKECVQYLIGQASDQRERRVNGCSSWSIERQLGFLPGFGLQLAEVFGVVRDPVLHAVAAQ